MSAPIEIVLAADPRVVLRGLDRALAEQLFREFLEERGWIVQQPREWEEPNDFCARIGIGAMTLNRKLRERNCPRVGLDRGKNGKGRLRAIAATLAFEEFCLRNKPQAAPVDEARDDRLERILRDYRHGLLELTPALRLILNELVR